MATRARRFRAAFLTGATVSVLSLSAVAPAVASGGSGASGSSSSSDSSGEAALVTTHVATPPDAVVVTSGVGRPGGSVDLRTFADCGGTVVGKVTSAAFAAPVGLGLAADGGLFAEARVAANARPGTYAVLELCAGRAVASGTVKVVVPTVPATGGGWGATRTDVLDGAQGRGALGLTAAAALGGLVLTGRRLRRG